MNVPKVTSTRTAEEMVWAGQTFGAYGSTSESNTSAPNSPAKKGHVESHTTVRLSNLPNVQRRSSIPFPPRFTHLQPDNEDLIYNGVLEPMQDEEKDEDLDTTISLCDSDDDITIISERPGRQSKSRTRHSDRVLALVPQREGKSSLRAYYSLSN
ncbi:hypothetical protein BV898_18172 [Hypsibius exemplaris]|uniref:Uncharacterized protein n=1 Tax=Hypsibius exemplaris TaxID=2072580 RepID=A0A9X6RN79_HYPEX|nr:hypothetical protein BV898_18172 [Hypsibius exemplaris]